MDPDGSPNLLGAYGIDPDLERMDHHRKLWNAT
jgi:hypothetical protein